MPGWAFIGIPASMQVSCPGPCCEQVHAPWPDIYMCSICGCLCIYTYMYTYTIRIHIHIHIHLRIDIRIHINIRTLYVYYIICTCIRTKGGYPQFKSAPPQYCGQRKRLQTKKSCGIAIADLQESTSATLSSFLPVRLLSSPFSSAQDSFKNHQKYF